jgi:hypothetical protein
MEGTLAQCGILGYKLIGYEAPLSRENPTQRNTKKIQSYPITKHHIQHRDNLFGPGSQLGSPTSSVPSFRVR